MQTTLEFDFDVDACGLMCPLPLLRLKKALQAVDAGQVVRVLATDPAAVLDFGVFVEQAGHGLLHRSEDDGVLCFLIRKGG
ncbi:MAG: sulfurtransferase TusA family protein [Candidatus Methylumidiphilus sp.]